MFLITYTDSRSRTGFGSSIVTFDHMFEMLQTHDVLTIEAYNPDACTVFTPSVVAALTVGSPSL